MNALLYGFRCHGLGVEQLLSRLDSAGIRLFDVQREGVRTLVFYCSARQKQQAEALLQSLGFSYTPLSPRGCLKGLIHWQRIFPSLLATTTALILLACSLQFIWRIDISGAGAYAGEIRQYLRQQGIGIGRSKSTIETHQIADDLLDRFPKVTWVRASMAGVTLKIAVTQGVYALTDSADAAAGDIVADRDGVIAHIDVFAGQAAVQAGDTVQAGDVLIYGRERRADGTLQPVHARGKIMARAWQSASATLDAQQIISTRTGNSTSRIVLACPYFRYATAPEPDYLTHETQSTRIALGGAWLPVWLERETIYELSLERSPRDTQQLYRESGRLALQNLLSLTGGNDEIIDKWLDYSMIEGGNIMATVTAELLLEIGCFVPASPD